jgi:hypothetical protein
MHYQQWRLGKIVHPVLGKFTASQAHIRSKAKNNLVKKTPAASVREHGGPVKKKSKVKKTAAVVAEKMMEGVKANLPGALKVDLDNYPKIKHQIDFLADKYLVNPEHVIIGLVGEALAARRERSDHE